MHKISWEVNSSENVFEYGFHLHGKIAVLISLQQKRTEPSSKCLLKYRKYLKLSW